jgi:hypothetical protein
MGLVIITLLLVLVITAYAITAVLRVLFYKAETKFGTMLLSSSLALMFLIYSIISYMVITLLLKKT